MLPAAVSRAYLAQEVEACLDLARSHGWQVCPDLDALKVTIGMRSARDGERFVLDFGCDDYKAKPPLIEFVYPGTDERGSQRAYPKGGNGYFHGLPCICAPFSRKAYAALGGPHGDWAMGNWMKKSGGFPTIPAMAQLVQALIDSQEWYQGRMA